MKSFDHGQTPWNRKQDTGNRKQKPANRKQETGQRKPETGTGKQETRSRKQEMGNRKADLQSLVITENGRMRLEFMAPSRGLIGFRSQFLTLTSGTGILTSIFDHYGLAKKGEIATRQNGVMVSMINGKTLAYALFNLQSRGRMFVGHGLEVYKGQIVGIHSRDNDLPVNPTKAKQLTNIRAAGTDENLILTPHIQHTLEQALEFIEDDELVEITPESIRLRKKIIR